MTPIRGRFVAIVLGVQSDSGGLLSSTARCTSRSSTHEKAPWLPPRDAPAASSCRAGASVRHTDRADHLFRFTPHGACAYALKSYPRVLTDDAEPGNAILHHRHRLGEYPRGMAQDRW